MNPIEHVWDALGRGVAGRQPPPQTLQELESSSGRVGQNTPILESVPEPDEIGNLIEEVFDLDRQINSELDSDDVQELLDSHNQEMTMDELIVMHEQEQDIEENLSL
ncbi:hypothetical protein TNCV_4538761 [Trichonephila clavipes]|uniref:Uncharacterized protein n=1 Tax=Trichonephila clavipes TaxID=2585209 RepID=A0A8X7BKC5_TRICX|nr:hypothetical protein TNCV_4538761 [Trichonephila clavipes]